MKSTKIKSKKSIIAPSIRYRSPVWMRWRSYYRWRGSNHRWGAGLRHNLTPALLSNSYYWLIGKLKWVYYSYLTTHGGFITRWCWGIQWAQCVSDKEFQAIKVESTCNRNIRWSTEHNSLEWWLTINTVWLSESYLAAPRVIRLSVIACTYRAPTDSLRPRHCRVSPEHEGDPTTLCSRTPVSPGYRPSRPSQSDAQSIDNLSSDISVNCNSNCN